MNKKHTERDFRRRTPDEHASLLAGLRDIQEDKFLKIHDPLDAWDLYYKESTERLNLYYPLRTITITSKDPYFITPEIKFLLRKKTKLLRRGQIEKVESLARRISKALLKVTTSSLRDF